VRVVADGVAAMIDKLFEGGHLGALGVEGFECVGMLEPEFSVGEIVLGGAMGKCLRHRTLQQTYAGDIQLVSRSACRSWSRRKCEIRSPSNRTSLSIER
jgi:hypothetical protein